MFASNQRALEHSQDCLIRNGSLFYFSHVSSWESETSVFDLWFRFPLRPPIFEAQGRTIHA